MDGLHMLSGAFIDCPVVYGGECEMNARNRKERMPLSPCLVCGTDSGERVQSTDAPFKHYVRCGFCGAKTGGYTSQNSATKAWQRGDAWK